MDYLPIFSKIKDQHCLIVGGGAVAARKADLFIKAGAIVTVISPELKQEMNYHLARGLVIWQWGEFSVELMQQVPRPQLVISATDNQAVNLAVHAYCQEQGIAVNVADQTEYCDFILPGIVERGSMTVAVSTGGRSPVLARLMKSRLDTQIPYGFAKATELVGKYRQAVKEKILHPDGRKQFWEELLNGVFLDKAVQGEEAQAEQILQSKLAQDSQTGYQPQGEVYLIGAGPGDPELMTFKALRLLQQADVVVYDRLVSDEIVDMARREAERVYVGKRERWHRMPQTKITQLLLELAQQGKKVARLKGGDPYIFGRGAEEVELLAEHGVPYQVVPGITAAAGCAAYGDFPLTHRDYSHSVSLVTGHEQAGADEIDYARLASSGDTMVFYMGIKNAAKIQQGLIAHGVNADMPAAIIENGTRVNQKVTETTLGELSQTIANNKIQPPALLVVGEVLKVRQKLNQLKLAAAQRQNSAETELLKVAI
ncbi:uroporphyrinogen-III C-methyltransferase [Thiomicrorhabdus sp. 6S2-11]|uniref:Siroheme synthase n=1 Tax=Thiomicrorhabdus marina TaxID=2818442 RepID=A0ABS3Q1U9_9GAMM|nr:siroheme synthase CysG [Thiomicrorhabdus marina]MBO1926133.1 uroporphyrinogen-III C-methyltransferase [Thiomicrorhabdus marina]